MWFKINVEKKIYSNVVRVFVGNYVVDDSDDGFNELELVDLGE